MLRVAPRMPVAYHCAAELAFQILRSHCTQGSAHNAVLRHTTGSAQVSLFRVGRGPPRPYDQNELHGKGKELKRANTVRGSVR